jgi:hypothetical protein
MILRRLTLNANRLRTIVSNQSIQFISPLMNPLHQRQFSTVLWTVPDIPIDKLDIQYARSSGPGL